MFSIKAAAVPVVPCQLVASSRGYAFITATESTTHCLISNFIFFLNFSTSQWIVTQTRPAAMEARVDGEERALAVLREEVNELQRRVKVLARRSQVALGE